jgi:serine/threonine-protein kinase
LELLGLKEALVSVNVEKKREKIANSSKQKRTIPWGDIAGFFLSSTLAGYLLTIYETPGLALSVAIAADLLAVSLAAGSFAAESSGCFPLLTFLGWAIAAITSLVWSVYLVWAATIPWGGIIVGIAIALVAAACILVTVLMTIGIGISATQRLLKSSSRLHTFLILLGTSWLGLGLGWLVRWLFW